MKTFFSLSGVGSGRSAVPSSSLRVEVDVDIGDLGGLRAGAEMSLPFATANCCIVNSSASGVFAVTLSRVWRTAPSERRMPLKRSKVSLSCSAVALASAPS
jgi:hypothetical protein